MPESKQIYEPPTATLARMAISNSLARDTCQQWKLESAEAVFETNTLATATSIELPAAEPLLHFSRRLDVVAWTLDRIQSSRLSK